VQEILFSPLHIFEAVSLRYSIGIRTFSAIFCYYFKASINN